MISIKNAEKLIKNYTHIIGMNYHGATIDELIITPRDDPEFSSALDQYRKDLRANSLLSIYPASNENGYTVTVIINKKGIARGETLYSEIFQIIKYLGIDIVYNDYGINL